MEEKEKQLEEELEDLLHELENFKKEKERVRAIVGKMGGVPRFNTKIYNIIFLVLILTSLIISLVSVGKLSLAMIELAVVALSLKLILLIHNQSRVNHFQLWIMSALEWRLNEIMTTLKEIKKKD